MRLCLFDPGLEDNEGSPSHNLGDLIIHAAVRRELKRIFGGEEPLRISTHAKVSWKTLKEAGLCDPLIVGGTNLLSSHMRHYKQWEINVFQAWRIRRAVLLGVGWWQYQDNPDLYTRLVLRTALSKTALHSVRDDYTRQKLEAIGFTNVINTGCPTMWPFADFDFSKVPACRAENALVMLTDYTKSPELDRHLLSTVAGYYKKVYFWPQGQGDLDYVRSLSVPVIALEHSMESLNDFLQSGVAFDYIGTRLHGGIYCTLAGKRSLVLRIDNRATEISRETGFPTVARDDFDFIQKWVLNPVPVHVHVNSVAIQQWCGQFKTNRCL